MLPGVIPFCGIALVLPDVVSENSVKMMARYEAAPKRMPQHRFLNGYLSALNNALYK